MATTREPPVGRPSRPGPGRSGGGGERPTGVEGRSPAGGDADAVIQRTRHALSLVFGPPEARAFAVRLWDGTVERPPDSTRPQFTLVLHDAASLRRMLLPPSELRLGASYVEGAFEVEGDLEVAQTVGRQLRDRLADPSTAMRVLGALTRLPRRSDVPRSHAARSGRRLTRWPRRHAPRRDAMAIRAHYDIGNDFYALWLDRRLVYSCAYFETGTEDLDRAQEAKLEHICRKLRLHPGERLLDIGCGWGGLVMYAAARYGVEAHGITLSPAQATLARERIAAAGLTEQCRVDVCDYRMVDQERPYDKVVSVGMVEHVGRAQIARYAQAAFRLTAPGGLFLNHGIVTAPVSTRLGDVLRRRLWHEGEFIDRYIFPDGELLRLGEIVEAGEAAGFEVRDVESLREHYVQTLRHWVRRLEAAAPRAKHLVGSERYRAWRLYMAASAQAFASRRIGLAQVLFAKAAPVGVVRLPRTRADLYVTPAAPPLRTPSRPEAPAATGSERSFRPTEPDGR